jgi:hypothetical protein
MKGSHLFWLSRSKGMTVDIWIRDYNHSRCFQKKISGRSKHNGHPGHGTSLLCMLCVLGQGLNLTQGVLNDNLFILQFQLVA